MRASTRQADPALDRLFDLPLVPCDGARVVRGSGHRGADERAVRLHQGRPRGAARPRRDLPRRRGRDDRPGRLAADGVPHSRRRAVPRWHVLPARGAARAARVHGGSRLGLGSLPRAARRRRPARAGDRRGARAGGLSGAVVRAADRVDRVHGDQAPRRAARPGVGRVRAGAEVPARLGARAALAPRRGRARGEDARRDGGRRQSDLVGGGFHRYSVDERWLVPHFEKMLYDNALLVPASTCTGGSSPEARATARWPSRRSSTCSATCVSRTAASRRRRTPTPRASRG